MSQILNGLSLNFVKEPLFLPQSMKEQQYEIKLQRVFVTSVEKYSAWINDDDGTECASGYG